jgi:hypothetical protein
MIKAITLNFIDQDVVKIYTETTIKISIIYKEEFDNI